MSSTILQPIADALGVKLTALGLGVNVWPKGQLTFGRAGAAEIELPDIGLHGPEESESQLGTDDWDLELPVTLYVDLREGERAGQKLAVLIEGWVAAVRADPGLGGLVLEARVISAKRVYHTDPNRPLVAYETTVAVLKLV